jgi:hypothetical protein
VKSGEATNPPNEFNDSGGCTAAQTHRTRGYRAPGKRGIHFIPSPLFSPRTPRPAFQRIIRDAEVTHELLQLEVLSLEVRSRSDGVSPWRPFSAPSRTWSRQRYMMVALILVLATDIDPFLPTRHHVQHELAPSLGRDRLRPAHVVHVLGQARAVASGFTLASRGSSRAAHASTPVSTSDLSSPGGARTTGPRGCPRIGGFDRRAQESHGRASSFPLESKEVPCSHLCIHRYTRLEP